MYAYKNHAYILVSMVFYTDNYRINVLTKSPGIQKRKLTMIGKLFCFTSRRNFHYFENDTPD